MEVGISNSLFCLPPAGEARGTRVRLLVFELQQPVVSVVARAVSWLKEGELTPEYCHWTISFEYPSGCLQHVNFDKDQLVYLRAEADWVPSSRAQEYEENKIEGQVRPEGRGLSTLTKINTEFLRAEADWVPVARAAMYEENTIKDFDLGSHPFGHVRVANMLKSMCDLGRYHYITNNCQLVAKSMLSQLRVTLPAGVRTAIDNITDAGSSIVQSS
ncbi:hypothetical protein MTO96_007234 [Rhipicephalus appendiculatus]